MLQTRSSRPVPLSHSAFAPLAAPSDTASSSTSSRTSSPLVSQRTLQVQQSKLVSQSSLPKLLLVRSWRTHTPPRPFQASPRPSLLLLRTASSLRMLSRCAMSGGLPSRLVCALWSALFSFQARRSSRPIVLRLRSRGRIALSVKTWKDIP